ncbi:MAG: radical SAM protein, partial [Desulfobacterales bacterium]|nr:radical SAM protein [Desulfobacterales bacterium]
GCSQHCVFCNQHTITGESHRNDDPQRHSDFVRKFLNFRSRRRGTTQLAFFGGNFLGMAPHRVRRHLDWAAGWVRRGDVDSLRFSTRPDTITPATLALIREYPVRTIELGAQSMNDQVLSWSRRGHTAMDTIRAVSQLKRGGYEIGLQIMTGLPGDSPAGAITTTEAVMALAPAFVRIYPTLVLAGSPLAAEYEAGRYHPLKLADSIDLVARMWLMLAAAGIRVVRMGLQSSPGLADRRNLLAGPYHPAYGEQVLRHVFRSMAQAGLDRSAPTAGRRLTLWVNPRRLSVMTGPQRGHLVQLREAHHLAGLRAAADPTLALNQLEVDNR